jgi:hypothetical protein
MELTAGRIVHVRNADMECRPAIVVQVWKDMSDGGDGFNGVVFRDGLNDRNAGLGEGDELTSWITSVLAGAGPHEYHDPRECPVGDN